MFRFVVLGFALVAFISTETLADRIVGGSDIDIIQVPYQVSLHTFNIFACGGSIIKSNVILTAAHCQSVAGNTYVRYGSSNYAFGGLIENVIRVDQHEYYNEHTLENDIALLYLENFIIFGPFAKAIPLSKNLEQPVGQMALFTGWGNLQFPGFPSPTLQSISVEVVTIPICKLFWGEYFIQPGKLCAGGIPGIGGCEGDSGGPLVINGIQIGITSIGQKCALGAPDGFTDVAYYQNWIRSKIEHFEAINVNNTESL